MIRREEIVPGAVIVGRNGRRRKIIDIDRDDDGRELAIYQMVESSRKAGHRYGLGYVGMCQLPQLQRWARRIAKEGR